MGLRARWDMYLTRLEDRLAWGREQGGIYVLDMVGG